MDFQLLLQPLNRPEGACGGDLTFSAEFDAIHEARRYDDPTLSQGEWVTELKEADWDTVIRVCTITLTSEAKDLRIAAWLTEAMGKTRGLPGLADGYNLIAKLCEAFWEEIHPQAEDGDMEQRIGALDWLAKQTPDLIRATHLTQSHSAHYVYTDLESARQFAKKIESHPGLAEHYASQGLPNLEQFEAATAATPKRFFHASLADVERMQAAILTLQDVLASRLGDNAPLFRPALEVLDDLLRFFRRQAGERPDQATADTTPPPCLATAPDQRIEPRLTDSPNTDAGPVRNRAHAIRQLREIAAFFKKTEPHSPVAYLAEKAAHWGEMPLHEWLRAVVKDDSALQRMQELLGVDGES